LSLNPFLQSSPIAALNGLFALLNSGEPFNETAVVILLYEILEERDESVDPLELTEVCPYHCSLVLLDYNLLGHCESCEPAD